MKAVTLRNLPPELARIICRKASEQGVSINRAVITLLQESAGLGGGKRQDTPLYDDLDALAGSWTEAEARAFERSLAQQRAIDPELWK